MAFGKGKDRKKSEPQFIVRSVLQPRRWEVIEDGVRLKFRLDREHLRDEASLLANEAQWMTRMG